MRVWPCSAVHTLTAEQFDSLATCFLHEIAKLEGWEDERPSWKLIEGQTPEPSRKLMAAFRKALPRHFRVMSEPRKRKAA